MATGDVSTVCGGARVIWRRESEAATNDDGMRVFVCVCAVVMPTACNEAGVS